MINQKSKIIFFVGWGSLPIWNMLMSGGVPKLLSQPKINDIDLYVTDGSSESVISPSATGE